MSTRSGKRIHGSFPENTLDGENEHVYKNDKKTRSKRQKENVEALELELPKTKKRNYVSYPKDEESISIVQVPIKKEEETTRVLRKTTLKEQNWNVSNTIELVDVVDVKKPSRQTRRTKKFAENNVEDLPPNNAMDVTETEVVITKLPKGKKNKKKRSIAETNENDQQVVKVSKKKSKKKKKKLAEETELGVKSNSSNKSNMSVDSFHSAAGSPVKFDDDTKDNALFDKSEEKSTRNVDEHNISKDTTATKKRRSSIRNNTVENINTSLNESAAKGKRHSTRNSTFELTSEPEPVLNSTFDKENKRRKSSLKNTTFDKIDTLPVESSKLNSTFEKTDSKILNAKLNTVVEKDTNVRRSMRSSYVAETVNTDIEKNDIQQPEEVNTTFDIGKKINSTFDKTEIQNEVIADPKAAIISSDDNSNLTYDKSDNSSRISITSDDSRTENIVNTTPVLIESSMDQSAISLNNSRKQEFSSKPTVTPIKREGTFTKEGPEVSHEFPEVSSDGLNKTPTKRNSLPSPGSTPFPFSKSSQKKKCMLNVTRSLEKVASHKSSIEPASRTTKVMFCSPVNNPAIVMQQKGKVIKSNLKGSNKSFVFDESDTSIVRAAPRKRSYTHNDVDDVRVKRKRLADDQQQSVDRLSRPRTSSSTAKPGEPTTPSKKAPTPAKSKSETKVSRTKLPNFAALHQRRFDKMESLDECQLRKAKRARQLLTPTASINVLLRTSPTGESPAAKEAPLSKRTKKTETPVKSKQPKLDIVKSKPPPPDTFKPTLPALESVKPGYTRFGFRMNTENPFSIPSMTVTKPKEKPNGLLTRQATFPSLTGTTSMRREVAKQTVMREKSFTLKEKRDVKRNENRTVIKGVRTNRRFELQMRMRNIS